MYTVRKYHNNDFNTWNQFVASAKNATFLFHRNFMEYHKDRFEDFSLMIFKGPLLIAALPANIKNNEVYSHQGLTYGGLLLNKSIGVAKVETIFKAILVFLKNAEIQFFTLKQLPYLYHKTANFELDALLLNYSDNTILKRAQGFTIDYRLPLTIHKTKQKHYKKNQSLKFKIITTNDFTSFWNTILIPRLKEKHKATPVHTLEEITSLAHSFPKNIEQYNIYKDQQLLAGITIFKTETVIKSQYGATSAAGEKYRALDFLFIYLINLFKEKGYRFFDMGIISGNYSLLKQKEELGGAQYIQDSYRFKIK